MFCNQDVFELLARAVEPLWHFHQTFEFLDILFDNGLDLFLRADLAGAVFEFLTGEVVHQPDFLIDNSFINRVESG